MYVVIHPTYRWLELFLRYLDMKQNKEVEVEYYDNGNKKYETYYKDGKKDGVSTVWYDDGTKESERHYKDGEENGVFTHWHDDGVKDCEYQIEDGECISYTQWNRDGDIDEYNTNNKTIG